MAGFTSYSIDNDNEFAAALNKAKAKVKDLRIPFKEISDDFYKSQKAIFQLQSPGKYDDLDEDYKDRKQKLYGFVYPILKASGRLERSVTSANGEGAINIITKSVLGIGTTVKYGVYHQSDSPRNKIPLRKFLFIGPEAPRFANSDQKGRLERWLGILNGYIVENFGD